MDEAKLAAELEHLAEADRHLGEADERIARQEERVEQLAGSGQSAEAKSLLTLFRDSRDAMIAHRKLILDEIERLKTEQ
jgi:hypothetical protein